MFIPKSNPTAEELAPLAENHYGNCKGPMPLHVHAELEDTIDGFLDQIEAVNKEYPVKNLRWVLAPSIACSRGIWIG
jgi:hypothetical protein